MRLPRSVTRLAADVRQEDLRTSLVLLAVALLLYMPGLGWGLPHASAPDRIHPWGSDELAPIGPFAQIFTWIFDGEARFDPRYPLFPYVIQVIAMLPYVGWRWLTGGLDGFGADYPFGFDDPITALAGLTLWARASNLVMVSAIPVIAYWTARVLWSRMAALITATLVLLMYHMFFYSRTSNVDGGMLFFAALGLFVFAKILREGLTAPRVVALGSFAALTIAAKDPGYSIFAAVAVVLAGRALADRPIGAVGVSRQWRLLLLGFLVSTAVYAFASGLAFSPELFFRHADYAIHGSGLRARLSEPATLQGYLRVLLAFMGGLGDAVGVPVLVLSALGLAVAAVRDRTALLFAVPALGLLAGVILPTRFVMFRYVLPAAYVFPFFAGYFLALLTQRDRNAALAAPRLTETGPATRRRTLLAYGCLGLAVAWSLTRGIDLTYQMLRDPRVELRAWMLAHARPGDRVAFYGGAAKLPALDSSIAVVRGPYWNGAPTPDPDWAEFLLLIPQQVQELEHELQLPAERYRALREGTWPYELVYAKQTRALFRRRPITWVNPPVRVFLRRDLLDRLGPSSRQIDLDATPPPP